MTKIYTIDTRCDAKTNSANLFDVQYQKIEESFIYNEVLNTLRKAFQLIDFNSILKKN